tara:strand:+ start:111 stop:317 length:207 start_codon:yes stop_codon:yes gene_type:complete
MKDSMGNVRHVTVVQDSTTRTYVGSIRGGSSERMINGSDRQPVVAVGESDTPHDAAEQAIHNFNNRHK